MKLTQIALFTPVLIQAVLGAATEPKYLQFSIQRKTGYYKWWKRDTETSSLEDHYSYYLTEVIVGSNEQTNELLVDTGSNALWFIDSSTCSDCSDGVFNTSASTSYAEIDDAFSITYGSGSASGYWANETVKVGNATVSQMRIGVATTYPADFGVMGLTVSPDDTGSDPSYENLPKRLKSDGTISKQLFSFYAGDYGDNDGSLLFGAVDHSKYTGDLTGVDMADDTTTVTVNGVALNSSYSGVDSSTLFSEDYSALIDTGTSTTSLPTDAFNSFISAVNATDDDGTYYIDCSLLDQDISLTYNISGVSVDVALESLVFQISSSSCYLGVFSTDSSLIIGGNALRSIYTVFDLEDKRIGIAQSNSSPGDEEIEVITSL